MKGRLIIFKNQLKTGHLRPSIVTLTTFSTRESRFRIGLEKWENIQIESISFKFFTRFRQVTLIPIDWHQKVDIWWSNKVTTMILKLEIFIIFFLKKNRDFEERKIGQNRFLIDKKYYDMMD